MKEQDAKFTFHDFEKPTIKTVGDQLSGKTKTKVATPVDGNQELKDKVTALELKYEETLVKHEAAVAKHEADHKTLQEQVTKLQQGNKQLSELVKSLMLKITELEFKLAVKE